MKKYLFLTMAVLMIALIGLSEQGTAQYEQNELQLLARCVNGEARGEPYEGQVAIGAVVMNRVKSPRYPNSIADVIYAPGQFGPVSNGSIAKYLANPKASCLQAAQDAINGYTTIGTFTHFKNARVQISGDSIVIGNHVFY